ncbi:TPA: hypothetical protein DDZ01_03215 [Candidatus Uhrbacteria bacterium]|nr:MAG: hypothetical protein A2332_03685 [Candidatus Uhrbacteria bacterium RIFOXYB2_FULL_41_18]HBK34979.1 hypothetical protein [Candidatus Uhrbacteria bacterium]HCB56021.1 hypothetical protein [Candidatus Uhrbacteria bacterium]
MRVVTFRERLLFTSRDLCTKVIPMKQMLAIIIKWIFELSSGILAVFLFFAGLLLYLEFFVFITQYEIFEVALGALLVAGAYKGIYWSIKKIFAARVSIFHAIVFLIVGYFLLWLGASDFDRDGISSFHEATPILWAYNHLDVDFLYVTNPILGDSNFDLISDRASMYNRGLWRIRTLPAQRVKMTGRIPNICIISGVEGENGQCLKLLEKVAQCAKSDGGLERPEIKGLVVANIGSTIQTCEDLDTYPRNLAQNNFGFYLDIVRAFE